MLAQTLKTTRFTAKSAQNALSLASRSFTSNPVAFMPKKDDDVTQQQLDENKAKLEELEKGNSKHGTFQGELKRPSDAELKKRGEDAQVEQQRPDDGVY
ncbi:LAMI_0H12420g1_1 [Lachancea mirantina]|uniref:LAMI_0H12420g1_1 n=1 Tax=Lachancea mirantina TaxID=1230905 RepID=A0A1G4KHM6_9SACH|nr:LAMI_0H12420g1_1 [Lachancea mirantina]